MGSANAIISHKVALERTRERRREASGRSLPQVWSGEQSKTHAFDTSLPMSRLRRWLNRWIWTLVDALPPYRRAEGPLLSKERGPDGRHYIRVGSARVEVDRATVERLNPGDDLVVRLTKGFRAVNIDLIQPSNEANHDAGPPT